MHLRKIKMAGRIAFAVGSAIVVELVWSNRQSIWNGVKSGWIWVKTKFGMQQLSEIELTGEENEVVGLDIEGLDAMLCPISNQVMRDPVLTPYGNCFERRSIENWLSQNATCPITLRPLAIHQLTPCIAMRNMIEQYMRLQSEQHRRY